MTLGFSVKPSELLWKYVVISVDMALLAKPYAELNLEAQPT